MKKIIQLSIIISSLFTSFYVTSSDNYIVTSAPTYVQNCQNLQAALNLALQRHNEGKPAIVSTSFTLDFPEKDVIHCRKNYRLQYPGKLDGTLSAININNDDKTIHVIVFTPENAHQYGMIVTRQ
jgi:hypothetical protein